MITNLDIHNSNPVGLDAALRYAANGVGVVVPIGTPNHYRCVLLHASDRVVYYFDSLHMLHYDHSCTMARTLIAMWLSLA